MGGALTALGVSIRRSSKTRRTCRSRAFTTSRASELRCRKPVARPSAQRLSTPRSTSSGSPGESEERGRRWIPSTQRTWTDVRVALAMPLGESFAIGPAGRWLRVEQAVSSGPFGQSFVSDGTPTHPVLNTITLDLGATLALGDAVRIGAVGHNLTAPGTSLAPTTGVIGIGYGTKEFSLEADAMADFTTYARVAGRAMVGGEGVWPIAFRFAPDGDTMVARTFTRCRSAAVTSSPRGGPNCPCDATSSRTTDRLSSFSHSAISTTRAGPSSPADAGDNF